MFNPNRTTNLRTWIDIDRDNLRHNYHVFRDLIAPSCLLGAVVKSNAYGHSLVDCAAELSRLGVDCLMTDSITEAVKLREQGIAKPILVLGYTLPSMVDLAIENRISLSISSFQVLDALRELDTTDLRVHLKFDTGMCRQGFFAEDAAKLLDLLIHEFPQITIEGVFTHFASAKNPAFPDDTKQQLAKFAIIIEECKRRGLKVIRHAAATSGTLLFPESHFDMVRVGIGLYGLWPSTQVQAACSDRLELRPILAWKSVVSEIKSVPAASRIGYDGSETLARDSRLGIVPIGYWHGYDRSLSSIGRVLINDQPAKVLGRVSMDMLIIDLTNIDQVAVGDQVTLLGRDHHQQISAEEIARLAETSNYEIVTRLNPLIKRFYI